MVERSVGPERSTRRDSTRAVVTDRNLADQIAAVLLVDRQPIRDAFVGEPVMEAMLMCAWALDHEEDEDFDAARALTGWARKRRRGAWRPTPAERIQYGSSDEQLREIDEALETNGHSTGRMFKCSGCGRRFRGQPHEGGTCRGCAKRNGAA